MKYNLIGIIAAIFMIAACSTGSKELTTSGGFSYKLLPAGGSDAISTGDYVFFHVTMMADEVEQFSSRANGQESMVKIEEQVNGNIITKAMQEVLVKATAGDSLVLMVPTDSISSFPPGDSTKMLYYSVQITDVLDEEKYNAKMSLEQAEAEANAVAIRARIPEIEKFVDETYRYIVSGKGGDNIQTTSTGLQYIMHEEGSGEQLNPGQTVSVHYYGVLKSDGKMFDNSWRAGKEFQFPLGAGRVIRGWDEGVALLRKGSKATLIIPYELGYGAAGSPPSIPAEADLIFYIEVPE